MKHHPAFGFNFDPSHFIHQFVDPVFFIEEFGDRIFHMHVKESRVAAQRPQRDPVVAPGLRRSAPRLGFRLAGPRRREVRDPIIRALNRVGYKGPLSIEWEDSGMDRERGAPEALAMVRRQDFAASSVAFDAAFAAKDRDWGSGIAGSGVGETRNPLNIQYPIPGTSSTTERTPRRWVNNPSPPWLAPRQRATAPEIGVGMLGYAFMGKAHTNAYKKIPYMMYPPVAIPRLVGVAGRNEEAVKEAALRFGYEKYYTDWRTMLEDDRIQLFDNGGPNDTHAEPCIAAAQRGMHVFCEKPMARNAEEAKMMWDAVEKAGVKHMVAFNYRFVPAVRLAYDLIQSGKLGQIYHFRAVYLQEWIMPHYDTPMIWRTDKKQCGSGAIGDLGSHIIDLGRFLVGDMKSVSALYKNFIPERKGPDGQMHVVDVDDAFVAAVEFDNGAIGTVEASRFCAGHKNYNVIEVNGEKGSIRWNLERHERAGGLLGG